MSELYLIRHGQASFGADNYDQLSSVGHQQTALLASFWSGLDKRFDAVYSGSLHRQIETANGLLSCVEEDHCEILEGFNEFVSRPILDAYGIQYAAEDGFDLEGDMKDRKFFQHYIEAACTRWIDDQLEADDIERFSMFKCRVNDALNEVMTKFTNSKNVLISTSGGVIGLALQQVLNLSNQQAMNINWMIYNTSVTCVRFSGKRKSLSEFNTIPHLQRPGYTQKITYR